MTWPEEDVSSALPACLLPLHYGETMDMEASACAHPRYPPSPSSTSMVTLIMGWCLPLTQWSLPFPSPLPYSLILSLSLFLIQREAVGWRYRWFVVMRLRMNWHRLAVGLSCGFMMGQWELITGVQGPHYSVQP